RGFLDMSGPDSYRMLRADHERDAAGFREAALGFPRDIEPVGALGRSRSRAALPGKRTPGLDELLPRLRDLCFNPDRRRLFLCDLLRGRGKSGYRYRLRPWRYLKRTQRDFPVQSDGGPQSAGQTENSFRQSQTILWDLKHRSTTAIKFPEHLIFISAFRFYPSSFPARANPTRLASSKSSNGSP